MNCSKDPSGWKLSIAAELQVLAADFKDAKANPDCFAIWNRLLLPLNGPLKKAMDARLFPELIQVKLEKQLSEDPKTQIRDFVVCNPMRISIAYPYGFIYPGRVGVAFHGIRGIPFPVTEEESRLRPGTPEYEALRISKLQLVQFELAGLYSRACEALAGYIKESVENPDFERETFDWDESGYPWPKPRKRAPKTNLNEQPIQSLAESEPEPDGLYRPEKLMVWAGVRYERLTERMLDVLDVLSEAHSKGREGVSFDEISNRVPGNYDGGFYKSFNLNRKRWPPVHPVREIISGDGFYSLVDPRKAKVPDKVPELSPR